jgi:hypothetical protein
MESVTEELRKEREAHAETAELLNKGDAKVRNMEHTHSVVLSRITIERDSLKDMLDRQTPACNKLILEGHELRAERDALRAEVAFLQKRLGDFAQMEGELKSPTPKQHPVAVGEWVRRTTGSDTGRMAQVKSIAVLQYDVQLDGYKAFWASSNCEPCDPPTEATHDTPEGKASAESVVRDDRNTEPKPGDTVRLVRIPSRDVVSSELKTELEWPWIERWGTLNQTALVVEPAYQLDGALSVCLSTNVHVRWPISCIEVITEATHDTEAGKAVAESAVSETVADEIKVGDLCEVFQATTRTLKTDIGITGRVSSVHLDPCHGGFLVKFDPSTQSRRSTGMQAFGLCDVRKVTT